MIEFRRQAVTVGIKVDEMAVHMKFMVGMHYPIAIEFGLFLVIS